MIWGFLFYFCASIDPALKKFLISLPFFFFHFYKVLAQNDSTSKSPGTIRFFSSCETPEHARHLFSDTLIKGLQQFEPYFMKGGLSSAYSALEYSGKGNLGFSSGLNSFDYFNFFNDSTKYFDTRTPYTDLKLIISSKKEQFFRLLHTQNITRRWNATLEVLRTNGDGFYLKQNFVSSNVRVSTNFRSKSERYGFTAGIITRVFKKDENGGMVSDSLLEANIFSNKKLFPVNLEQARTRRGYRELFTSQYFYFGKNDKSNTDTTNRKKINPESAIVYSMDIDESWYVYSDKLPLSGYYDNIYLDSNSTLDSTHVWKLKNRVSWMSLNNPSLKIKAEAGVGHDLVNIYQQNGDSVLTDLLCFAKVSSKRDSSRKFEWSVEGQYFFNGNHAGDEAAGFKVSYLLPGVEGKVFLSARNSVFSVPYFYSRYTSNHFWWYNNFNKISASQGLAGFESAKWKLSTRVRLDNVFDYVYLDQGFLPKQVNYSINIMRLDLAKDLSWKKFHLDNVIVFQKADHAEILRLPELVLRHSLYFSGQWFRKAMEVNYGLDVLYFSSFFGDAYMPASGTYYLQDGKKIGNYPFVDLFFNCKIKRARVFLKTEHVVAGFIGNQFYTAPHYPGNDRQFRVGISWKFFD